MDITTVLMIASYGAALLLCGVAIWGIVQVVGAARSLRRLAETLQADLPPLIGHADATLQSVDAELRRMDDVVTQLEEVSDRVSSTTRAAREIVEAPVAAVSGLAAGARSFVQILTGRRV